MNKITLYLMSLKGLEVLKAVIASDYKNIVEKIIIGRDAHIQNDYAEEIVSLCKDHDIPYHYRTDVFTVESAYSLAISWRWLIHESPSRLIVLHDSLLPKYRGFAPLVNMLINREDRIGVTALFANQEYDRGDIIYQSSSEISYPMKISDAIEKISENYIETVIYILERIHSGTDLTATPQNENEATYSLWRDEDDYLINWTQSAESIENFIQAVGYPYRGASTFINQEKIRILEAESVPDVKIMNRTAGKIIFVEGSYPVIVCGEGLLRLTKVISDRTDEDMLPFKNFRIKLHNKDENSF
ncbi:formyltransferase family protein [Chryseobacterium sp. MYb264]|uniref:formyltransferase family protein n=1 Tax=Chryseobacterium sp. MYb264 TaxID=2745153 RepID=UPI002E0F1909|nr:formyltransferase family protein [Chryseobacterium sp. MYb264]